MSDSSRNGVNSEEKSAGSHSLAEILSQPECWSKCLEGLRSSKKLEEVRGRFAGASEWLFVGCGSSFYVALAAAATMSTLTGQRAQAVPASEVLLHPELVLASFKDYLPVLISRSGRTSEVLRAAELLKSRGVPTLAITCTTGEALEGLATATIVLPAADEKSTVMTRSFTSMLLALQNLAAAIGENPGFSGSVHKMPAAAAKVFEPLPDSIRTFVDRHHFADYVYLAQGPLYGLACEGALKITEMSLSYAQAFHTLEFRHGPKSIVGPETLLVFLLSESGYEEEVQVLEEMKSLGGTTLAIGNQADARAAAAADLLIELHLDGPELARVAPHLFAAQLLGLFTGLKKGLDPDLPRNLSRVVVLDDGNPQPRPVHAAF